MRINVVYHVDGERISHTYTSVADVEWFLDAENVTVDRAVVDSHLFKHGDFLAWIKKHARRH